MSSYRERREARADRLDEWAGKREARAASLFDQADSMASVIPFGQPILVGHYSEGRDRRYRDRIHSTMDRAVESANMADSMAARAQTIRAQADHAIYSDDEDACDRLRARIAELEAEREACKAANVAYRRGHKAELAAMTPYQRDQAMPHRGYELTNLGGNITRNRKRLADLERQAATPAGTVKRRVYNRRPGPCAVCGETVDAAGGCAELIDEAWSVRHWGCEQ